MRATRVFEAMGVSFDLKEILPPAYPYHRIVPELPDILQSPPIREAVLAAIAIAEPQLVRELVFEREEAFRSEHDLFLGGPLNEKRVRCESWFPGHFRAFKHEPAKWAVYQRLDIGAKFLGWASSAAKGRKAILISK